MVVTGCNLHNRIELGFTQGRMSLRYETFMSRFEEWEKFWQQKAREEISDHEYDRGSGPRGDDIENLSTEEMLEFVAPDANEVIFDAGCGSGINLLRFHSKVSRLIGMDYIDGAIKRCEERIASRKIRNVELIQGSITEVPLPDHSVDKVLCMSVLQYLDDEKVRTAFREFTRVMKGKGILILHVKNLSSIYISSLRVAKRIKLLFRRQANLEYVRPFKWYMNELTDAGYEILDYNSFNIFMVDALPRRLVVALQGIELRNRNKPFFRAGFIRRHGSDLKIKARFG